MAKPISTTDAVREAEIPLSEIVKTTAIAWTGALLEWVDFYIYASMAAVIAAIFFPKTDPIAALLSSYAALLVGFLFRPLGALLFGRIGDIYGRKRAFVVAALMMLSGTLGLGLLPTYAQAGLLASALVFILRAVQGLALGGGFGAVIVYLGESVPENRRGLYTGILFTTAPVGIALASLIVSITKSTFGDKAFMEWAWRVPFIFAGLVVLVAAIILHLFYSETPVFKMLRTLRRVSSAPIREVLTTREYRNQLLLAWIGLVGAHGPVWYTNQVVSSQFMQWHGVDVGTANWILSIATLAVAWAYILFGYLSDVFGRKKILLLGIYGNALWFIPAFWLLREAIQANNTIEMFLVTMTMTFFNGIGYSGAMSAYLLELFPSRIRLTATSLSYNLGYGITGGATPLVITMLYKLFNDWYLSVIAWSTIVPMVMGLVFVFKGRETLGARIWAEFTARKFAREAVVVKSSEPLRNVVRVMVQKGSRGVVVDYGDGVGVAYRRLLKGIIEKGLDSPVGAVAAKVRCVEADEPIPNALKVLQSLADERFIPVCEKGRVVGVIDERSLLGEVAGLSALTKKPIAGKVKLGDIGKRPIVISRGKTVGDAIRLMLQHNIGILPVVDEHDRLVAVFSERDALKAIANGASLDSPLLDYATANPKTLSCNDTVNTAAELALKLNIRHVVGVDAQGRVQCVASVRDLLAVG